MNMYLFYFEGQHNMLFKLQEQHIFYNFYLEINTQLYEGTVSICLKPKLKWVTAYIQSSDTPWIQPSQTRHCAVEIYLFKLYCFKSTCTQRM